MKTSIEPCVPPPLERAKDREKCERLAHLLDDAFDWEKTPQGRHYWKDVYNSLMALSKASDSADTAS